MINLIILTPNPMLTQRKSILTVAIGHDFMECTEDTFRTAVKPHMRYGTNSIS